MNLDNENDPSNLEGTKKVSKFFSLKSFLTTMTLIPFFLFLAPVFLGEFHGQIPDAVKTGKATVENGYKVVYEFGFITKLLEIFKSSSYGTEFFIGGLLVLAFTPIVIALAGVFKHHQTVRARLAEADVGKMQHAGTYFKEKKEYETSVIKEKNQFEANRHGEQHAMEKQKHDLQMEKEHKRHEREKEK